MEIVLLLLLLFQVTREQVILLIWPREKSVINLVEQDFHDSHTSC
jgi:hypothetical protein